MSGPREWAAALGAAAGAPMRILFERQRLVAHCRPLSAGEIAECADIGGERGARYALYLSCEALRIAGEQLRQCGCISSAFDITERLSYSDIMAAASVILSISGGGGHMLRLLRDDESDAAAVAALGESASSAAVLPPRETDTASAEIFGQTPAAAAMPYAEPAERIIADSTPGRDFTYGWRGGADSSFGDLSSAPKEREILPRGQISPEPPGDEWQTADSVARIFAARLKDAAGNM